MTVSTRARLLAATSAVIADEGWAAATTRRVAEHAGLAPGLVHYHAGTIEQLRRDAVLESIRSFFAESLDILRLSADDGTGADSSIDAWIHALVDPEPANAARTQQGRILQESLAVAGRDDALRESIAALVGQHRAVVEDALARQGVRDPHGTASMITAIADGIVLQRMLDPSVDLTPVAASIEDLFAARRA